MLRLDGFTYEQLREVANWLVWFLAPGHVKAEEPSTWKILFQVLKDVVDEMEKRIAEGRFHA